MVNCTLAFRCFGIHPSLLRGRRECSVNLLFERGAWKLTKNPTVRSARGVALEILTRVEAGGAYADILLDRELKGLGEADRALATELVYGVLRWQIKIDWIIDCFSKIKTKKLEHRVLCALRMGVYQLLFLTRIPPQAAVSETVELVKPGGFRKAGFVNAVLRMVDSARSAISFPLLKREPVRYVSVVFSHPQWLVERWIRRYGIKEAIELCQANLRVPPVTIRTNTLALTRDELLKELEAEGIESEKTRYSPAGIEITVGQRGRLGTKDRRFYIQDEASQLVPLLLSPEPGESVLDACAAPGGKSIHIAQIMENRGVVYAMDKHASRLRLVDKLAKRFGVDIIRTFQADAAGLALQPALSGLPAELRQGTVPGEGFDAVLVDAPCSGLGVIRRTPEIKLRRKEGDLEGLSSTQKRLLDNLSKYVRTGGRLVYSVCTFEPEETDEVVDWFLKGHGEFHVEDASMYLPPECRALVDGNGYFRSYPHLHGLDGFFAVRMKRG